MNYLTKINLLKQAFAHNAQAVELLSHVEAMPSKARGEAVKVLEKLRPTPKKGAWSTRDFWGIMAQKFVVSRFILRDLPDSDLRVCEWMAAAILRGEHLKTDGTAHRVKVTPQPRTGKDGANAYIPHDGKNEKDWHHVPIKYK